MVKKRGGESRKDNFTLRDGLTFEAGGVQVDIAVDQQLAMVYLDSYESSCINLIDPRDLEFEYMQQMTAALDAFLPDQTLTALHLGGAACALPLAWYHLRADSTQTVVELNGELATAMRKLFDLPRAPYLRIREGEAWAELSKMKPARYDVIVRDVFAGPQTPAPLRTLEFYQKAYEVLKPGGLLLINCIHGRGDNARDDIASALEVFKHVSVVAEGGIFSVGRRGNVVIVAVKSDEPDLSEEWNEFQRLLRRLPLPTRYLNRAEAKRWAASHKPMRLEVSELAGAEPA